MKKVFEIDMSWRRVLILSVLSAAVTALLNCIPALEGSSFTAPAETLELWIVLAVFIIMNCENYKDAVLKTFVFFLISQPLIYLIEVPFKAAGWSLFGYYPFWGLITVLTIPGAAIAYRVKKGDALAAVILSAANIMMIITGLSRISTVIYEFPRLLISLLFCLGFPFFFIFTLLKQKRSRAIAIALSILAIIAGICVYLIFPSGSSTSYPLEEGSWSVVSVSEPGLDVSIESSDSMNLSSHKNGVYTLILEDENGRKICYEISVDGGNHYISVGAPHDCD